MTTLPSQYAAALLEVLATTPSAQEHAVLDRFAQVLVEDRQLNRWPEIAEAIAAQGQPRMAQVAQEADRAIVSRALGELAQLSVDASLIAGAVIQVGERRVDSSVAGRLQQLRQVLRSDQ